jgi:hypothetical protein
MWICCSVDWMFYNLKLDKLSVVVLICRGFFYKIFFNDCNAKERFFMSLVRLRLEQPWVTCRYQVPPAPTHTQICEELCYDGCSCSPDCRLLVHTCVILELTWVTYAIRLFQSDAFLCKFYKSRNRSELILTSRPTRIQFVREWQEYAEFNNSMRKLRTHALGRSALGALFWETKAGRFSEVLRFVYIPGILVFCWS